MLPWQTFFDFLYLRYTLAPPSEYDWIFRVQQQCSLMSNYFDRLLNMVQFRQKIKQTNGFAFETANILQWESHRLPLDNVDHVLLNVIQIICSAALNAWPKISATTNNCEWCVELQYLKVNNWLSVKKFYNYKHFNNLIVNCHLHTYLTSPEVMLQKK